MKFWLIYTDLVKWKFVCSCEIGFMHRFIFLGPKEIPISILIEDELHHLLDCQCFYTERSYMLDISKKQIAKFNSLSKHNQFLAIMKNTNTQLLDGLAKFLTSVNLKYNHKI